MKQAYIKRKIESTILEAAKYFPVITVTGPRQSGKRTIIYAGTLLLMKRAKAVRSIINGRRHALRLSISRMQSTKRISRDRSAEKEIPTRQPQCTNLCSTIDIIYILALYIKITDLLFVLIRDTIETQRGSQYQ